MGAEVDWAHLSQQVEQQQDHLHEEPPTYAGITLPTTAQYEVLQRLADGQTTAEIAAAMYHSVPWVKYACAGAIARLGARTLAHAMAIAYEKGLLGACGRPHHGAGAQQ